MLKPLDRTLEMSQYWKKRCSGEGKACVKLARDTALGCCSAVGCACFYGGITACVVGMVYVVAEGVAYFV